jgi:hypothetical protein
MIEDSGSREIARMADELFSILYKIQGAAQAQWRAG